jgi:general secretion pathway protein G
MTRSRAQRGASFLELLVTAAVLAVLATAVIPLVRWEEKRRREDHLKVTLQTLRAAIDQYNKYMREGLIQPQDVEQCVIAGALDTCWPLTLEELVEGVQVGDLHSTETKTLKFLQRIPIDPFTERAEWGVRSFQDDWDATSWGGENVYDVYSLSPMRALDGTYYRDW